MECVGQGERGIFGAEANTRAWRTTSGIEEPPRSPGAALPRRLAQGLGAGVASGAALPAHRCLSQAAGVWHRASPLLPPAVASPAAQEAPALASGRPGTALGVPGSVGWPLPGRASLGPTA